MKHDKPVPTSRHIFGRHVRNEYQYNFFFYAFCVSPKIWPIINAGTTSTDNAGGILCISTLELESDRPPSSMTLINSIPSLKFIF